MAFGGPGGPEAALTLPMQPPACPTTSHRGRSNSFSLRTKALDVYIFQVAVVSVYFAPQFGGTPTNVCEHQRPQSLEIEGWWPGPTPRGLLGGWALRRGPRQGAAARPLPAVPAPPLPAH